MTSCTFHWLKSFCHQKNLPIFSVNANSISLLSSPINFYNQIYDSICASRNRIYLSALYFGVGKKEAILVELLQQQIQIHGNLSVDIYLDSRRGTRQDEERRSSVSILETLIKNRRASLHLVDTIGKGALHLILSKFPRWNEVISTFHSKILVFDDDVLLTGANLSSVYFDKRRDRYMFIKKSKILADYLADLLSISSQQNSSLNADIQNLNTRYRTVLDCNSDESNTYIVPLIQFGRKGLTFEDQFFKELDMSRSKDSKVYLSSGYFNPSPTLKSVRIDSILTSSEEANNFSQGSGLLKLIPKLYSAIQIQYKRENPKCDLRLFSDRDWSFHTKGLWFESHDNSYINIIGSSNYNYRSALRDFEVQFLVVTNDSNLIERLEVERSNLWASSSSVNIKAADKRYHILSKLYKSFL